MHDCSRNEQVPNVGSNPSAIRDWTPGSPPEVRALESQESQES
jgi:hypothetical protein